ncbi:MAG: lipid A deacylase LpxR family protein [Gemmatimonadaceae bacterium]|nr:lipid A deacylase LpxR family protein [Gemmatimonadaceae bacterium]
MVALTDPASAQEQRGGGAGADSTGSDNLQLRPQRPVVSGPGRWRPSLRLDNDAYNFWIHPAHRTDEEFTNGVVASLEALGGSFWGPHLARRTPDCAADTTSLGRCLTTTVSIGQDMYTPRLTRAPYTTPTWADERPYAGWLWIGVTGSSVSRRSARTVDVQLGVTGRPALGQTSQQLFHWINQRYTRRATGWETQVGFQPGVQLGYTHSLLALRGVVGSKALIDFVPSARVAVGTVRTAADVAGRLRIGYNLSHALDPRATRRRSPLEYYLSASGRTGFVARDFSLDGSIVDRERHVDRVPGVREYAFGMGLRLHHLRLQWEATTRSRQYATGPRHHTFSSMTAAWEFFDGH